MGMENTLDTTILHTTIISGSYGGIFASQLSFGFYIKKLLVFFFQGG